MNPIDEGQLMKLADMGGGLRPVFEPQPLLAKFRSDLAQARQNVVRLEELVALLERNPGLRARDDADATSAVESRHDQPGAPMYR